MAMQIDAHLRRLTNELKETLVKCALDPDVDAVHHTRIGTRRIEAILEAHLRSLGIHARPLDDARAIAAREWERLLKRVRRAAAPVRDLDVQRKILKKLVSENLPEQGDGPRGGLEEQAEKLDHALHSERDAGVEPLKKNAAKWAEKLEERFSGFAEAMAQGRERRVRKPNAAKVALDAFARLSTRMPRLDAGNLHDFRKSVKKARYMAEAGADDAHADSVAKALKRVQDAIGDWHDWVMLAGEAHKYLAEDGARLTAEIDCKREERFAAAMKLTGRMRGKLMGEWVAGNSPSRRRRRGAAPAACGARRIGLCAARPKTLKDNRIKRENNS